MIHRNHMFMAFISTSSLNIGAILWYIFVPSKYLEIITSFNAFTITQGILRGQNS